MSSLVPLSLGSTPLLRGLGVFPPFVSTISASLNDNAPPYTISRTSKLAYRAGVYCLWFVSSVVLWTI